MKFFYALAIIILNLAFWSWFDQKALAFVNDLISTGEPVGCIAVECVKQEGQ